MGFNKIMKFSIFSIIVVMIFASLPANSEIYRWTDADGNVHFGDRPPVSKESRRIEVNINSYESVTVEPFVPFKSDRPSKGKSVVMYSTTWCGFCRKARNYLKKNKIPFAEYDVENSEKGRRDYKKLNGKGVPILLIGDKRMNGFNVSRFKHLYGG